jgi:hypothetical protein
MNRVPLNDPETYSVADRVIRLIAAERGAIITEREFIKAAAVAIGCAAVSLRVRLGLSTLPGRWPMVNDSLREWARRS